MNSALVKRIELEFHGVPRGKVGVREASALDSRLNEPGELLNSAKFSQMRSEEFRHLKARFCLPRFIEWAQLSLGQWFGGICDLRRK